MDVNFEYFLAYVEQHAEANPSVRVLDFGCGDGSLVNALRDHNIACFGAEIFYAAGAYDAPHLQPLIAAGTVRPIPADGGLPFEDDFFDLVISNQVLEHVENLESVVGELSRVLRPTGRMYHHFPSIEVIREGHFGIPLSHWIQRFTTRRHYMLALRALGLGYHKRNQKGLSAWADDAARYIEDYCYYRPYAEIRAAFSQRYRVVHREIDYIRFRARGRRAIARLTEVDFLAPIWSRAFRRLGFMAIELTPFRSIAAEAPGNAAPVDSFPHL